MFQHRRATNRPETGSFRDISTTRHLLFTFVRIIARFGNALRQRKIHSRAWSWRLWRHTLVSCPWAKRRRSRSPHSVRAVTLWPRRPGSCRCLTDVSGFWTSSKSGKAKRLRNNTRVTVVPCNNRGKVADGASPVTGTAQLVSGGAEFDEIRSKVKAKYGVMVHYFEILQHPRSHR